MCANFWLIATVVNRKWHEIKAVIELSKGVLNRSVCILQGLLSDIAMVKSQKITFRSILIVLKIYLIYYPCLFVLQVPNHAGLKLPSKII